MASAQRIRQILPTLGWVVWGAAIVATVVLFAAAVPLTLEHLETVCQVPHCEWQLDSGFAASLANLGLSMRFYAISYVATEGLFVLIWCTLAALIFWRRPSDLMALVTAIMLVTFGGTIFTDTVDTIKTAGSGWWLIATALSSAGMISLFGFFCLFPDGRLVPRWTRFALAGTLVWSLVGYLSPTDWPISQDNPSSWLFMAGVFGFFVACLAAQVYRYQRVSSAIQRQQAKWVVFGIAVAILGFFVEQAAIITGTLPSPDPPAPGAMVARFATMAYVYLDWLLIPLSIAAAISRYRLFDIDRLINRTLVYAALTAALALVYAATIALTQHLFHAITGQGSDLAIVASTLAIAALFQPLQRRIQTFIDRRFYRRKYDAARILAAFATTARDTVEIEKLREQLEAVVDETMQPAHVSLWLRLSSGGRSYGEPLVVEEKS